MGILGTFSIFRKKNRKLKFPNPKNGNNWNFFHFLRRPGTTNVLVGKDEKGDGLK